MHPTFDVGRMARVQVNLNYKQADTSRVAVSVRFLPGNDEMWETIIRREPMTEPQAEAFRAALLTGKDTVLQLHEWTWSPSKAAPLGFLQENPARYQAPAPELASVQPRANELHEGCGGRIIGVDPDGHGNLYHCAKCGSAEV